MKVCTKCGERKPIEEFGTISYCKSCRAIQSRAANEKNKDARRATKKKWLERNGEKVQELARKRWADNKEEMTEKSRAWQKKNKSKVAEYNAKRDRFASTISRNRSHSKHEGYAPCTATAAEIKAAFTGFCQNPKCRVPESECTRKLSLDHDHETGEFRGWLCGRCNAALGLLRDSSEVISGLAEYIKNSNCRAEVPT